jgi:hypothetical protein
MAVFLTLEGGKIHNSTKSSRSRVPIRKGILNLNPEKKN